MKLSKELVQKIATQLKVDTSKISLHCLEKGMRVETEHKDLDPTPEETGYEDWVRYAKIALAHLKESPKYYEELDKMEKKLKEWIKKPL